LAPSASMRPLSCGQLAFRLQRRLNCSARSTTNLTECWSGQISRFLGSQTSSSSEIRARRNPMGGESPRGARGKTDGHVCRSPHRGSYPKRAGAARVCLQAPGRSCGEREEVGRCRHGASEAFGLDRLDRLVLGPRVFPHWFSEQSRRGVRLAVELCDAPAKRAADLRQCTKATPWRIRW